MKEPIPYTKPSISTLEVAYAADAAANGWGTRCYEYIDRFESSFGAYLDVNHVVATSSATGALHLGLAALGVEAGDEVILADTNWIATAAPVAHLGARPIFVDVREDSWCIDPERVEEAISSKTKAIIATHLYGNTCDMDALLAVGRRYGVPVIEDAAEAIGSELYGKRAGSLGLFSIFSFHGTKTITTGEGGAFATNDAELYEKVLTLSNHGRARGQSKQFWPDMLGFKYKMSNVQAAIGCAQLERVHELVQRKRAILAQYRARVANIDGIALNPEPPGTVNGAWMPTAVFSIDSGVTREALLEAFSKAGVDARVFFWPLSTLSMFDDAATPIAHSLPARSVNLPSFHDMTDHDQERVVDVLRNVRGASGGRGSD